MHFFLYFKKYVPFLNYVRYKKLNFSGLCLLELRESVAGLLVVATSHMTSR